MTDVNCDHHAPDRAGDGVAGAFAPRRCGVCYRIFGDPHQIVCPHDGALLVSIRSGPPRPRVPDADLHTAATVADGRRPGGLPDGADEEPEEDGAAFVVTLAPLGPLASSDAFAPLAFASYGRVAEPRPAAESGDAAEPEDTVAPEGAAEPEDTAAALPPPDRPAPASADTGVRAGSLVGRVVDRRYRVEGLLGEGGMGAVYRAVQTSVRRPVALKVLDGGLPPDAEKRFLYEARATSSLRSVHTVTIHDFGRARGVAGGGADGEDGDDILYIAMELLEGESLEQRLLRTGPPGWRTAAKIVAEIAESLHEAHRKGIVHRDLKPGNVLLVDMDGDPDFVKVIDFGIAKLSRFDAGAAITQAGQFLGTPAYCSPEQVASGEVGPASDLYALGVVLYELLTGRPPFVSDNPLRVVRSHVQDPPPPLEEVAPDIEAPGALRTLLARMLEKSPTRRIGSAALVRDAARALLADADDDVVHVARRRPPGARLAAAQVHGSVVRPEPELRDPAAAAGSRGRWRLRVAAVAAAAVLIGVGVGLVVGNLL